jgi:glutamine amidotransferase
MGWNNMLQEKEHSVLNGLNNKDFYFVHSYRFKPKNKESILANTYYGEDFPSVLCSGNIIGTQFHPEKSQEAGIALLKNFLEWAP